MKPRVHLINSILFMAIALRVFPELGMQVFWFFIGGFGIDFDYYLYYSYVTKDFNLGKMLEHYREHYKDDGQIRLFHTIEFLALMLIGSFYFFFVKLIFIGMLMHVALDWFDLIAMKKRWRRRYFFFVNWAREKLITQTRRKQA